MNGRPAAFLAAWLSAAQLVDTKEAHRACKEECASDEATLQRHRDQLEKSEQGRGLLSCECV